MPISLVNDEPEPTSVTGRILSTFLDALATEDGYADVAARLRQAMLQDGDFSERALRTALFGDSTP